MELKKKHSSRAVGGVETGSRADRTHSKAAAGGPQEVADCGTNGAGQAAAGRPHKVVAGRPHGPTFMHR